MELEEPEGDMELEEPDGDIEPVDELEGEVTLGEVEEGFFILKLERLEHAPKAKADAIAKDRGLNKGIRIVAIVR